jgi:8-oxo-dGTP diphosphatase
VTVERSERVAVGAIIVDDEGRVFVHRRGYDRALFPGCWDIPGGHVEGEETPLETLAREVQEETGWRVAHVVAELGESVRTGDDGVVRREYDYWSRSKVTSRPRDWSIRSRSSATGSTPTTSTG